MNRIHKKIRNLIDDCHKKFAKYLCENYKFILIPEFETQEMTNRMKRKINSKTARKMITWAHYRFKMFLEHKMCEYSGRILII